MITASGFRPAWWLPGPHLQTLYSSLLGRGRALPAVRERVELPDGDFLDIDWLHGGGAGLVLLLHGLEGSSRSHYIRGLAQELGRRDQRVAIMHFRGCSGEPNRLARGYHSGETGDLGWLLTHLREREPRTPIAAVGYSLGGNVLLKYLGERGEDTPLVAAVAVSVPFVLSLAATRINQGFSRLYQWHLLRSVKRNLRRKWSLLEERLDLSGYAGWRDFWQFDDAVTGPLHGFEGVHDYYTRSSSRQFLGGIRVPTLILHARDDPLIPAQAIPSAGELSPEVSLELSEHGGHVGFIAGAVPLRPRYWLERRIAEHLAEALRPSA